MGTSPDQLRDQIEATRADMTHNVDVLAEKVNPSAIASRQLDTVKGALGGVKDKVMGAAHGTGDHVSGTGTTLSDKASGLTGSVSNTVSGAPEALRSRTQGSPLAAGLIAFGAGLVLSSLLPASEKEQQAAVALKDKATPLVGEAKTQTSELKDNLTPFARGAVEQVKSTATDAVAATKDHASSATAEVTDHAQAAAAETKDDVADHAAAAKDEASA